MIPRSSARSIAARRASGGPPTINPADVPHPKPISEISRPVWPSIRYFIADCLTPERRSPLPKPRTQVTRELSALQIAELLLRPEPHVAEVSPGMFLTRAFEAAEAAGIVAAAAGSKAWRDAGINANLEVDRSVRAAEVLYEAADPLLIGMCRDRLFAATRGLASAVAARTVLAEIQIVRYHVDGRYIDHRDSPAPGATPRALSLVCYLNDDFVGGATAFAEPDIAISPLSGVAVVFSPVRLHRAEPVTAGTKYVITAWYHVPPSAGA